MKQYLGFIDEIGRTIDGNYLYRLDFTTEPDIFWGDEFNVSPSIIIPNLQPDKNNVSMSARLELPYHLNLAKRSGCFSMQDCFDKIIALGFTDISNDETLIFEFSDTFEEVNKKLNKYNYTLIDIEEFSKEKDEHIIDDLIENLKIDTIENKTTHLDYNEILDNLYEEIITIKKGDIIKFEKFNEILFNAGYERTDYIHKKKQYTIRGYIIDVFSSYPKHTEPFRIEFFGDEVEKIYTYDLIEQTPISDFEEITIYKLKDNGE